MSVRLVLIAVLLAACGRPAARGADAARPIDAGHPIDAATIDATPPADARPPVPDATPADARPLEPGEVRVKDGVAHLPGGVTILLGHDDDPVARRGDLEVDLAALASPPNEACCVLLRVWGRVDGSIDVDIEGMRTFNVPAARLEARFEAARAEKLEGKKRDVDAEKALAHAVELDPEFEAGAFARARVRVRLGDPARAAAALSTFLARRPPRVYLSVLADASLAPVLAEPAFAALRAHAGDAHLDGPTSTMVAYSPTLGAFAAVEDITERCGCFGMDGDLRLVVFDAHGLLADQLLLARQERPGHEEGAPPSLPPRAQRLALANRLLADLGFDVPAGVEWAAVGANSKGTPVVYFPLARLGVALAGGTARLLRGDQDLGEHDLWPGCTGERDRSMMCQYPPRSRWAAWVPSQQTVIVEWTTEGAEHHVPQAHLDVWRRPALP